MTATKTKGRRPAITIARSEHARLSNLADMLAERDPHAAEQLAAELDRATNAALVEVERLGVDEGDFSTEYDPGNPAADEKGFVKMPNVNVLVEMADMREANRSYEANLQSIKQSRDLISATIDLLRASQ